VLPDDVTPKFGFKTCQYLFLLGLPNAFPVTDHEDPNFAFLILNVIRNSHMG